MCVDLIVASTSLARLKPVGLDEAVKIMSPSQAPFTHWYGLFLPLPLRFSFVSASIGISLPYTQSSQQKNPATKEPSTAGTA